MSNRPLKKLGFNKIPQAMGKKNLKTSTILSNMNIGTQDQLRGFKKLFWQYGSRLEESSTSSGGKILKGNCPFHDCLKEDHMYVSSGTGQFNCKRCGRVGNSFGFIRQIYQSYVSTTTDEDYENLSGLRQGIPVETLKKWGLVYNSLLGEWMIPSYNFSNEIINLHRWITITKDNGEETRQLMGSSTFISSLYGLQYLEKDSSKDIFVLEGHWDIMAFDYLLTSLRKRDRYDLIAVPGAGTCPASSLSIFANRGVTVVFDNDQAGHNGQEHMIEALCVSGVKPKWLCTIPWPVEAPIGMDVRDLCIDWKKPSPKVLKPGVNPLDYILEKRIGNKLVIGGLGTKPEIHPTECSSFEEVVSQCRKGWYFNSSLEGALALLIAVNISVSLGGSPLWVFLIGPPASGKTTLAELVGSASPYSIGVSKFTGLVSGTRLKGGGEAGLLGKLKDILLIIKDFTSILCLSTEQISNVFGDFRDAYDGQTNTHYNNGVVNEHKGINFGVVACVTDAIRLINTSSLGERFCCVDIDSIWSDSGEYSKAEIAMEERTITALSTTIQLVTETVELERASKDKNLDQIHATCLCWGFLDHIHGLIRNKDPILKTIGDNLAQNEPLMLYIGDLAKFASLARTTLAVKGDQVTYRTRADTGIRLSEQLVKLTISLCLVFQVEEPTDHILSLVRKVALDTCMGFQLEIMLLLAKAPKGLTIDQLRAKLGISKTGVVNLINNLLPLEIVKLDETDVVVRNLLGGFSRVGRPSNNYVLTPEVYLLATNIGFTNDN